MKDVDDYLKVRYAVQIEGLSKRAAARRFGIDPRTVSKMMTFSVPQGYVRSKPPVRPKLDAFIGIIDKMLADDKSRPKKQQHTSKRIFERLRDEHGFTGGIVPDLIRDREGLRGGCAATRPRDVCAAGASPGTCAGRLRRGAEIGRAHV